MIEKSKVRWGLLIISYLLIFFMGFKLGGNQGVEALDTNLDSPSTSRSGTHYTSNSARQTTREKSESSDTQGLQQKAQPVQKNSISSSGRITSGVAEAFGLTTDERKRVDAVVARSFEAFIESVADRAILDTERSDEDNGVTIYTIPALPDRGEELFSQMKNELVEILGQKRGGSFAGSFQRSNTLNGFGSTDTTIRFRQIDPSLPATEQMVDMADRHPETGDTVTSWTATYSSFQERFGEAFTIVQED